MLIDRIHLIVLRAHNLKALGEVRQHLIDGFPIDIPQARRPRAYADDVDQAVKRAIAVIHIPADVRIAFGNDLFTIHFCRLGARSGGGCPIA